MAKITSIHELQPGDHISKPGDFYLYRHHMMITELSTSENEIKVIHKAKDRKIKLVKEEWIPIDPSDIVKHEYPSDEAEISIERARSKLQEDSYSLFTDNCEHFIKWAKTDNKESLQVQRGVKTALATTGGSVGGAATGAVIGGMIGAAIGSVVPVAGTAVGGMTGVVIGSVTGTGIVGAASGTATFIVDWLRENKKRVWRK